LNKYRIYIDEVGNSDLKSSDDQNHRYLSLTGVIFDLEYVKNTLNPEVEGLKVKYFDAHPDEAIILHRKELVNKRFPFQNLNDEKIGNEFNEELLQLLKKWDYKIITVVIDKMEHNSKYQTWKYDPYHYCMEIMVERFYYFLRTINSKGDVMIESRGGKEDMRLKTSYRRIMNNGTHYVTNSELQSTLTSLELKVKPKSANISGLQIADLLAFPSRRHVLKYYNRLIDDRITFNEEIISVILNKYDKKGDRLEGYGIKMLP